MKRPHLALTLVILLIPAFMVGSARADTIKNHFASIMIGSKKIGQVHYTAQHNTATKARYRNLGLVPRILSLASRFTIIP